MFDKIASLLLPLVQKYGTRFLVTLGIVGAFTFLVYTGKMNDLYGAVGMTITAVFYFVFRSKTEIHNGNNK